MKRDISIYFAGESDTTRLLAFYDVSSDCTDEQISAFASVCGEVSTDTLASVEVNESRSIEV